MIAIALACAAVMGFAIQRGATCTVAAVEEVVTMRRVSRLLGMVEAAFWVAGGLMLARVLGRLPMVPVGYVATGCTVAGGVLLGLGACVNGACVFGAIARLGSGEWAYAATPLGYFLGCASVRSLFAPASPERLADSSPLFAAPAELATAFVLFALWRVARQRMSWHRVVWEPHAATTVIGITFLFTFLAAGAWAYTDLLDDLARGMPEDVALRTALFGALLSGAAWGGASAGLWRPTFPQPAAIARCLAGGALMGWGTLLIPGSNDALILIGMPLLQPYAWLAFATMCLTIAVTLLARRRLEGSQFHHGAPRGDGAT